MSSVALSFKRIDRQDLRNEVFGRRRQLHFELLGKGYLLEPLAQMEGFQEDFTLKLEWMGIPFVAEVQHFPPLEYFGKTFEGLSLETLTSDLNVVVLNYVLGQLLDELESRYHQAALLNAFSFGGADQPASRPFYLQVSGTGLQRPVSLCLHVDEELVPKFMGPLSEMPLTAAQNFGQISFDFVIEYGRIQLPAQSVQTLALGDVLLLPADAYPRSDTLSLILPDGMRILAKFAQGVATVSHVMSDSKNTPTPAGAEKKPSTPELSLDELPVTLSFDVGNKTLPLKELKSLKPGYTFTLEHSVEAPVFIRANGRLVGQGELVQIEEHVGVRVLSFLDNDL